VRGAPAAAMTTRVITGRIVETPEQWAQVVHAALGQAPAGFILAGQYLTEAKAKLGWKRDGAGFEAWLQEQVRMSPAKARMLMAVGDYYQDPFVTLVTKLPGSWRTLYELRALDPELLIAAINAGHVHPDLDRRDASALVLEYKRAAAIHSPAAASLQRAQPRDRQPVAGERVSVRPGDWWQLGEHLLYCGDSASGEFISRAQGAAFAFADPPYNVGKGDWDQDFTWEHDWLAKAARIVAVTPGDTAIFSFAHATGMPYRCSMAAWITNGTTRSAVGFGNYIFVPLFSHEESVYRCMQNVLRISIGPAALSTIHEAPKPFGLLLGLLKAFTVEGDLVVDPFLGSGTTLFAAEQEGRRCIGAEIVPEFCAEIIAQYGPEAKPLSEPPPPASEGDPCPATRLAR
jgi:DNA modification methylase